MDNFESQDGKFVSWVIIYMYLEKNVYIIQPSLCDVLFIIMITVNAHTCIIRTRV